MNSNDNCWVRDIGFQKTSGSPVSFELWTLKIRGGTPEPAGNYFMKIIFWLVNLPPQHTDKALLREGLIKKTPPQQKSKKTWVHPKQLWRLCHNQVECQDQQRFAIRHWGGNAMSGDTVHIIHILGGFSDGIRYGSRLGYNWCTVTHLEWEMAANLYLEKISTLQPTIVKRNPIEPPSTNHIQP